METKRAVNAKIARAGVLVALLAGPPGSARAQELPPAPPPLDSPPGFCRPRVPKPPPALLGVDRYRSPGLAVVLSLQPLPIDVGNLYAENLAWGIGYSAVEVSLMAPMVWLAEEHAGHGSGDDRGWTRNERGAMIGLVTGYVVVKLAAAWYAGNAARAFNQSYEARALAFVAPERRGATLVWSRGF